VVPELLIAIVGPVAGACLGMGVFFSRRVITRTDNRLQEIAQSIELLSERITELKVSLPTNYVNKDDFRHHIRDEERWQEELMRQFHTIHVEIRDRSRPK